jgi:hypothetical protein
MMMVQELLISSVPEDTLATFFEILKHHLFFRDIAYSRVSRLEELFSASPFNWVPAAQSSAQKPLAMDYFNLLLITPKPSHFVFGLRVNDKLEWEDIELALLCLKLIEKHRAPLGLGFIIACYALHLRHDMVSVWHFALKLAADEVTSDECHRLTAAFMVLQQRPIEQSITFLLSPPVEFNSAYATGPRGPFTSIRENLAHCDHLKEQLCVTPSDDVYDSCRLRLSRLTEQIAQTSERNSKSWRRFWCNVAVDSSPWDPSRLSNHRVVARWKRDPAVFGPGIPVKMKRNRTFNSHMDASIARDAGSMKSAEIIFKARQEELLIGRQATAPPAILEIPIEKIQTATPLSDSTQKVSRSFQCQLIKIRRTSDGVFNIFGDWIQIVLDRSLKRHRLQFSDFKQVLLRQRLHRPTAIEIFIHSGRTFFLNFPGRQSVDVVKCLNLPDSVFVQREDFAAHFQSSQMTQLWLAHRISSFQYLVSLNIMNGRSFNDASQYPLFPWVLKDYSSDRLDLDNADVYRDLALPVGALDRGRLQELCSRMSDMERHNAGNYLYSSYAICPLSLYLWLVRMEPFATMHIDMQSRRFDYGSRLFYSLADAWHLVTCHLNDYRELISEFYFQPEFLVNENEFDLGFSGDTKVGDVILPPWANESPSEFIDLMRKALESDRVSAALSNWIDLVFGYKQTGQAAVDAFNVYNPDVYEEAWKMFNPGRHRQIEATMEHIGQVPTRLFAKKHPEREAVKIVTALSKNCTLDLSLNEVKCVSFEKDKLIVFGRDSLARVTLKLNGEIPFKKGRATKIVNEIVMMVALPTGRILAMLTTMKLLAIEGRTVEPAFSGLVNILYLAASADFMAIVSDSSTLNVVGPAQQFAIPFYGDAIAC